jgi:hypothetical protein
MNYVNAVETAHLDKLTMQKAAHSRREYKLEKIILAEQERLEAIKRELNEANAVTDEETINARNIELNKIAAERVRIE